MHKTAVLNFPVDDIISTFPQYQRNGGYLNVVAKPKGLMTEGKDVADQEGIPNITQVSRGVFDIRYLCYGFGLDRQLWTFTPIDKDKTSVDFLRTFNGSEEHHKAMKYAVEKAFDKSLEGFSKSLQKAVELLEKL